jgi:hypothetical protein
MTVLLVLCLTSAYAGNERKIGTAGAQELLIPVGSRGTAMGGSVVADVYGLDAIYWNPAGLGALEGTEAMFSHQPYIADININYGALGTAIEDFGSIALAVKVVSIGDIEETTELQPEGTGSVYSPTLSVMGLSYARYLTANVTFGVTANFINEKIFDVSATGLSFDAGVIYSPDWRGVSLGIVMKNYGPNMQFDGSGFQRSYEVAGQRRVFLNSAPFELPAFISLGAAYEFLNNGPSTATFTGNFQSNNHTQDLWLAGFEYAYDERYFLRGGYNYADQDQYLYGLSLGAGLHYTLGETMLTFEYAWTETELFEDNQYFTVTANF